MQKGIILYFYILVFVLVFLVNLIMDLIKIKKKKFRKIGEIQYLVNRFNLDINKIKYKSTSVCISLINAFIIATVTTVVSFLDAVIAIQLLCGFVLLFALIYMLYEIYGRILIKKGYKKKGSKK